MRDVEAFGNGFVFVAVAHHPLGFGLGFLCDVEEKDAREEENNQQHSECCGHGVLSKPGSVGVVRLLDAIIAPGPGQCQPPVQ